MAEWCHCYIALVATKMIVAISAYNRPDSLADLIDNVRHFADPEELVVFDCSPHQRLTEGLGVSLCPYSEPLRWGHLAEYFIGVMRWLQERRVDYDYLVTLHSDMLLVRSGLADYLDNEMVDSEYEAPGYLRTNEWCESRIPCLRRFHYGWKRVWGSLFKVDAPSWAYSPGQVFRQSYADKMVTFPDIDRLIKLAYRSKILGIEEVFFATLADAMGCNPLRFPEEHGCHQPILELPRLRGYLKMPTVYFVHKVSLEADDPVRLAVQDLRHGRLPKNENGVGQDSEPWPLDPAIASSGITDHLKDLYFHWLP